MRRLDFGFGVGGAALVGSMCAGADASDFATASIPFVSNTSAAPAPAIVAIAEMAGDGLRGATSKGAVIVAAGGSTEAGILCEGGGVWGTEDLGAICAPYCGGRACG